MLKTRTGAPTACRLVRNYFSMTSPQRAQELQENYAAIVADVKRAAQTTSKTPRLVLVSKLKPPSDIQAIYEATGHKTFGENYIQELVDKARLLPPELEWHFIGSLQSNKCKTLAGIPNLAYLETLDSVKKADLLEKALAASNRKIKVLLQVNTSGEEAKAGLPSLDAPPVGDPAPDSLPFLARHVLDHCPHLELRGVMTIGSWDASHNASAENPDFGRLRQTRDYLAAFLERPPNELELSMGMSADFEAAIAAGSDNVRVGSRAFGQRPSKEDAKAERVAHQKGI